MGYRREDVYEFWKCEVMCFDKDTNSELFAEFVNMFLKLKQESSGYPSWVQSEGQKDEYIEDYRRAEGIALDKASILQNFRATNFGKIEIELNVGQMGTEPEQDPDDNCGIGKSFTSF
jgi:hypothetical protein